MSPPSNGRGGLDGSNVGHQAGWVALAGALAAVGLLRAAHGYRSFPSIDDFAYVPMAFARLDAQLYPRDLLLQETPLHLPLLPPLVSVLRVTTGLELGFWLLTIALSVLTLLAMYRWMRAMGVPGVLLPAAAILVCAGRVEGLGRGEYDGLFGDAFHFQWAALCALLWGYDALLRARMQVAAALVVCSLVLHPVVGVHGLVCMAFGLALGHRRVASTRYWWVPAAVGSCAVLGVAVSFLLKDTGSVPISDLPNAVQGVVFRLPHEYSLNALKTTLLLALAAAGLCGVLPLARQAPGSRVGTLFGLQVGHLFLLAAACLMYDVRSVAVWGNRTLLPFQLSLFRSTPVLIALSSVSAVTALEAAFLRSPGRDRSLPGIPGSVTRSIQVGAVLCLAVFQVRWSWEAGLCCGVAILTALAVRRKVGYRILTAAWLVALVGGLALFARSAPLAARLSDEQAELFRWVRSVTPADALFIVPPSFQEFRLYTLKSAYVDFKTVTPANPRLVGLWRQRLEQVAAPDREAREARGWQGIVEWDRTYAGRNTPTRITRLLRETGADYFVWDRQGLQVPPFVPWSRTPDPELALVFANARYEVYRLLGPPGS